MAIIGGIPYFQTNPYIHVPLWSQPTFTAGPGPDPSRYVAMGQEEISKLTLVEAEGTQTLKSERDP